MTWATLAVVVMTRQILPSWRSTVAAGLLTGLAIATRTGGIITHVYLFGAMLLCIAECFAANGRLTMRYLMQMGSRYAAVVGLAWITAVALWPWLQIGNPLEQFKTALVHFASIPMTFEFTHWGERVWTNSLPRSYIPNELLARLPEGFLFLLAVALIFAIPAAATVTRETAETWRQLDRTAALRAAALALAQRARDSRRGRCRRAAAGVSHRPACDDLRWDTARTVRHSHAGDPGGRRTEGAAAAVAPRARGRRRRCRGIYRQHRDDVWPRLHPLEYVAMNALAGGTRGAYDNFELDYWSAAASEALRRLEHRLDYDPSARRAETPPSILICIPWREWWFGRC